VADGETITVLDATSTQHKIRLQGIDAPEKAQPLGQKSKQSLSQLVYNKQVTVEYQKKDNMAEPWERSYSTAKTFV
jgi:endonuclease YncB( thermonuclease family)